MTNPDPAVEILLRHLANLHELMRQSDIRLRRIEACLGLMAETGRLTPLGALRRPADWPVGDQTGDGRGKGGDAA